MVNNILVLTVTLAFLLIFFSKKVKQSRMWHATVTPLASIIGSGFLVSVPLLVLVSGKDAAWIMLIIALIGYALGSSTRINIQYAEPKDDTINTSPWLVRVRYLSRPVLGIAYVISVTFYLKLLSAFFLQAIEHKVSLYENILTTFFLLLIGITGKLRGLKRLELFEICCVNTKLAIIFAMIAVYGLYNLETHLAHGLQVIPMPKETLWIGFRKILGLVIIIQGFETSRYLGQAYDSKTRILSMRNAQIISGIIYVVFVALAVPVIGDVKHITETIVITISSEVATFLPFFILIAAFMSQFSAAVADTVGGAGLLVEGVLKKIGINNAYLVMTGFSCVLVWATDIFEIITIASKAFALFYFLQIIITLITICKVKAISYKNIKLLFYSCLLILMGLVVALGIPAE